jgi:hypothetical protein
MSSTKKAASKEVKAGCCEGQLHAWVEAAEKAAHREPVKCAFIAFISGLLITLLPVGQIVGGLTRLGLALVRPALIVLGAMKLIEEIEQRRPRGE